MKMIAGALFVQAQRRKVDALEMVGAAGYFDTSHEPNYRHY